MLPRILTAAVLALAVAPLSAARPAKEELIAFVSAERAAQLVAVDLRSRRVIARIPVAPGPHNVAASPDGRFVLGTSPPAGRVTLVDGRTLRVRHVFSGFGYPHDVELDPIRPYAYVTDERRGELVALDLARRRVAGRVAVGAGPHDLAVSPGGTRAWVTHGSSTPALTIVDTSRPARPRIAGRVPARGTHDIAFSEDGLHVWITYWGSNRVGAFEAIAERLRLERRVGTLLHHVQMGLRDEVWLTDHGAGRVYLLSARTGRVVQALAGCPGAHHVAVAGGAYVAVACHDADALAVYERRTWRRTLVPVGRGPHGVAVAVLP